MFGITHENNKAAAGLKRYVLDAEEDVKDLPTTGLAIPGSTAFVIATSNTYMLNNQYTWVKVNLSSGSGGSDTPDPGADNTYIWNGGTID